VLTADVSCQTSLFRQGKWKRGGWVEICDASRLKAGAQQGQCIR
jgi:hypothetical protein